MYGADQQRLSNILNNETQRYGTDVGAATTQRGQDVTRELGLGNIAEQRYGTDTTAGTAARGQDITRELGLGNIAEQRYGTDVGAATAMRGQDATVRGQDLNYQLGQGNLDLANRTQDFSQADTLYQRGLTTNASLGGNVIGNPTFGNPPAGTSGNTQPAGAVKKDANGNWLNASNQIWNAITSSWT
jgi:hypothetical protein